MYCPNRFALYRFNRLAIGLWTVTRISGAEFDTAQELTELVSPSLDGRDKSPAIVGYDNLGLAVSLEQFKQNLLGSLKALLGYNFYYE